MEGFGASGTHSTSTASGDPELRAWNQFILPQLQQAVTSSGGIPGLTAFRPLAVPASAERDISAQISRIAQQPVDVPGYLESNIRRFLPEVTRGYEDAFRTTAVPSIVNYLTAAGMGRSGAVGEAIARAGAEFTRPAVERAIALAQGLPLPGAIELSRLPIALQAEAAPRQAQLLEESTLRNLLLPLIFRGIAPSGAGTTTASQKEIPDYLKMLLGGLGTGLTAYGTAPGGTRWGPPMGGPASTPPIYGQPIPYGY